MHAAPSPIRINRRVRPVRRNGFRHLLLWSAAVQKLAAVNHRLFHPRLDKLDDRLAGVGQCCFEVTGKLVQKLPCPLKITTNTDRKRSGYPTLRSVTVG